MTTRWRKGYPYRKSWTGVDWTKADSGRTRIDPYLVWAEATNFIDLGVKPKPRMRVPLIIELAGEHEAWEFADLVQKRTDWDFIKMSELYLNPPEELKHTKFCTAIVTRAFFTELGRPPLSEWIARFELGLPMRPEPGAEDGGLPPPRESGQAPARSATAIVGIIDDGMAFAHERFRARNGGTRIDYFWNQGYPALNLSPTNLIGIPGYGRDFDKAEIDELMKVSTRRGLVDEDLVYRKAAYREVGRSWAHGTHVMDLACGLNPADVTDSSPHIVCVQLQPPSRTTRDRSTGWLAMHALEGLRYVLHRADMLARLDRRVPVVVNLSFGHIAGPHDGTSMLEEAMHELIVARRNHPRPLEIVIAVGNSLLPRCHAKVRLAPKETRTLHWRVLPDDATPSFMEIWLKSVTASLPNVQVEVETPWGDGSKRTRRGDVRTWRRGGETLAAIIRLDRVATGRSEMILLAVAPTQRLGRKELEAPCGTWAVRLTNSGAAVVDVDAYIERDETPYGFPRRGRQSRFDDPNYERFDRFGRPKEDDRRESFGREGRASESYIKRANTINSIATGKETVVIAGSRRSDWATARYSSNGRQINAITAAGISEDSVTCHGVLAAGSRSGSKVVMNGTSVAAPQLTRELAKRMANDVVLPRQSPQPTGRQIVEKLAALAEKSDASSANAPASTVRLLVRPKLRGDRSGKGRVDARPDQAAIRRRIGYPRDK
jgi:hypothetical protein